MNPERLKDHLDLLLLAAMLVVLIFPPAGAYLGRIARGALTVMWSSPPREPAALSRRSYSQ
jgi:hypothetical protein